MIKTKLLLALVVASLSTLYEVNAMCCHFTVIKFRLKGVLGLCHTVVPGSINYPPDPSLCLIKACGDGLAHEGMYCATGSCNIFGCNCDGQCFTENGSNDALGNFMKRYGDVVTITRYSVNDLQTYVRVNLLAANETVDRDLVHNSNTLVTPTPRIHSEMVCVYVHFRSTKDLLKIQDIVLPWGKLIKNDLDHTEVYKEHYIGKVYTNTNEFYLCASGRQGTPSGTEGTFEYRYEDHEQQLLGTFRAKFDVPYMGPTEYEVDFSSMEPTVSGTDVKNYAKQRIDIYIKDRK